MVRPEIQLYGKRESDVHGGRITLPRVERLNVVRYLRLEVRHNAGEDVVYLDDDHIKFASSARDLDWLTKLS